MTMTPKASSATFRVASLVAVLALAALTLGTTAFAGSGPGSAGSGPANGPGSASGTGPGVPAIDPSLALTLEGPVVSFLAGPGAALPTLAVDDAALGATTVRLGPFWFLTKAGFTAEIGDSVRLVVYPCSLCTAGYVAVTVENLSTGVSVTLRADDGTPLWPSDRSRGAVGPGQGSGPGTAAGSGPRSGAGPGHGQGPRGSGCLGPCTGWTLDFPSAVTVTGTVMAFTGGPGVGMPMLTLEADGETLLLVAGPWYVWQAAGYLPVEGDLLEITYVSASQSGEDFLVLTRAVEVESGLTVILRDPEAVRAGCPRP